MNLRAAIRRCLPSRWRHASGGGLPPYRPDDDSVLAPLSPGYVHIPPEMEVRLTPEQWAAINKTYRGGAL